MSDETKQQSASDTELKKVWLWRNHVDGRPEYWAFDNPFPIHMDNDDPQTLGEPCGYALVKPSRNGRPEVTEQEVLRRIDAMQRPVASTSEFCTKRPHRWVSDANDAPDRCIWCDATRPNSVSVAGDGKP